MAQFIIPETFADSDGFKAGLSPTITIRQRDEQNQSYIDVISDVMEDKGLGDYVYTFIGYDKSQLYTYKIDGGSDDLTSRYSTGNNQLDYYSNKVDWGSQFRGAIGGFSDGLYKEIKKILETLETYKPKDIDWLPILTLLQEIKDKGYPEYNDSNLMTKLDEIEDKLEDKSDKMEIVSTIKSNEANLTKSNDEHRELIAKMLEQMKADTETIKELRGYIEKLIKRGNITRDSDFRRLVREIDKREEEDKVKQIEIILMLDGFIQ